MQVRLGLWFLTYVHYRQVQRTSVLTSRCSVSQKRQNKRNRSLKPPSKLLCPSTQDVYLCIQPAQIPTTGQTVVSAFHGSPWIDGRTSPDA